MTGESTFEIKKAQASAHKGVVYDARIDKFTGRVCIDGRTIYLGAFETAGAAATAYKEIRAAHPIQRRVKTGGRLLASFSDAFGLFLQSCERDRFGNIAGGEIFTAPDGQRYRMSHVQHYTHGDEHRSLDVWEAPCRNCGRLFSTKTVTKSKVIANMVRTCAEHRGQLKPDDAPDVWPDPQHWANMAQRSNNRAAAKANPAAEEADSFNDRVFKWYDAYNVFWPDAKDKEIGHALVAWSGKLRLEIAVAVDFLPDRTARDVLRASEYANASGVPADDGWDLA